MFSLAIILRYWKLALGAGLLLALGVQSVRIVGKDRIIAVLRLENTKLRFDLDRVADATKLAAEKAKAAKLAQEAEYRKKADETDANYKAALDDARARAADYARRMRVHAPGAPGGPATPADSGSPQGADGAGEGTFVAVSQEDFDILNENTERLKAARNWACGLEGAKCVE